MDQHLTLLKEAELSSHTWLARQDIVQPVVYTSMRIEQYPTGPRDILTVAEVARELRCSKVLVYRLIRGEVPEVLPLPAIFIGRRRLVRRQTLEQWKTANERGLGNGMIVVPELDAERRMKGAFHA